MLSTAGGAVMDVFLNLRRVIHIPSVILMAWPFYALVAVNNRARLGPPLGDRADTYLEGIIKNRTMPCFVFQGTALITGLALLWVRGRGLATLITNPAVAGKFVLLLFMGASLSYVHRTVKHLFPD